MNSSTKGFIYLRLDGNVQWDKQMDEREAGRS